MAIYHMEGQKVNIPIKHMLITNIHKQ
jgi:hypothetical protein